MFDHCTEPAYLQRCLESFLGQWHGAREPWFGIDPQKLAQTQLPQPLMWLYGYAGAWHGHSYWNHMLGNQDCLVPFESLAIENGKLVFVWENQCVWKLGTATEGADPAVWMTHDDQEWHLLTPSLSQFLVTFILHETLFGLQYVGNGSNLCAKLTAAGMQVVPLWLDKPYPNGVLSFHVANGRYLIMNDSWCATDESEPWTVLPEIFKNAANAKSPSGGFDRYDAIPAHIQVPSMVRAMHLQMVIERHQHQIDYHEGRCRLYREMLKRFESESINTPARS